MRAQASPWHLHALQRATASPPTPLIAPERMEWTTRPGDGPGAEILGPHLRGKRIVELGCGPGHNAAHLASHAGAYVTGVDLVGVQVHRARSHYGRLDGLTFVTGHALSFLQSSVTPVDACYSVFGAVGLVDPALLLPAITRRLGPEGTLVFSVPHPRRGGSRPATDHRPRRAYVHLPDCSRWPVARWEHDIDQWMEYLARAGLGLVATEEFAGARDSPWPATLVIAARKR
jgi:SAM-dependent methyltransferase